MQVSSKVLIVDDSILSRSLLSNAIKQEAGANWDLVEATCGEDALEKLSDENFDHYIIDFNMPGMNGLEVAEEILKKNGKAHIALCTANIQNAIKEKAHDIGLHFIGKPITEESVKEFLSSDD